MQNPVKIYVKERPFNFVVVAEVMLLVLFLPTINLTFFTNTVFKHNLRLFYYYYYSYKIACVPSGNSDEPYAQSGRSLVGFFAVLSMGRRTPKISRRTAKTDQTA